MTIREAVLEEITRARRVLGLGAVVRAEERAAELGGKSPLQPLYRVPSSS